MHDYRISDSNHFFSYETGVSIELPIDWEQKDESNGTVAYVYQVDNNDASQIKKAPALVIKKIDIPAGNPDAYKALENELIEMPRRDKIVISQTTREIDGLTGLEYVLSYIDDEINGTVVHIQSLLQVDNSIYSISGIVEEEHQENFMTVFEDVMNSVRIIPI